MALNWLLSLKRSSRTIMWGFQTKQSGWPSSQQDRNCPKAADSPISIVSPSFKLTALNCYHIVCFSRFTICPNDQAQTAWIHFLRGEYFCCRWITVCSLEHPPDFMNIWSNLSESVSLACKSHFEELNGAQHCHKWFPWSDNVLIVLDHKYKKFELRNMEPQNRWEHTDTAEVQIQIHTDRQEIHKYKYKYFVHVCISIFNCISFHSFLLFLLLAAGAGDQLFSNVRECTI